MIIKLSALVKREWDGPAFNIRNGLIDAAQDFDGSRLSSKRSWAFHGTNGNIAMESYIMVTGYLSTAS